MLDQRIWWQSPSLWAVLIHRPYHTKVHGPSQMSSHVGVKFTVSPTPLMPSTFNLIVVRLWRIKNWYITWNKTQFFFFFHNCLKNSDCEQWTQLNYINPTLFSSSFTINQFSNYKLKTIIKIIVKKSCVDSNTQNKLFPHHTNTVDHFFL